jgi:two-component system LytT family response regulator
MIKTAIVDDEPPARRKLRRLLAEDPDFTLTGEAGSGAEAVSLIRDTKPDLVFLDIQLPDCSGFDVLNETERNPGIHYVFVTAHDDFALRAFEVHVLDYLLKPVEPSRFAAALERFKRLILQPHSHSNDRLENLIAQLRTDNRHIRRLLVQENERSIFIETSRIDWLESARNYICVHAGSVTHILRSTLESVESKLDPSTFRRLNRSQIVNIDRIAEIRTWTHGDQKVILRNGTELMWSRRYRPGSLEELERG